MLRYVKRTKGMKMKRLMRIAMLMIALMGMATPAYAEEIYNQVAGPYWDCDYYGSDYWCWAPNLYSEGGHWIRSAPGWQYTAGLGGG
jgi:hypothetical protein